MASADQSTLQPSGQSESLATIKRLWPYLWPAERPDLRRRVAIALVLMLIGKVVTVLLPYVYKWTTDSLLPAHHAAVSYSPWLSLPVVLVVAYGVVRILFNGLNQLRDALFASVGQYAVRGMGTRTFQHLHELSLRFHLARRTGGLSRVIERGAQASKPSSGSPSWSGRRRSSSSRSCR